MKHLILAALVLLTTAAVGRTQDKEDPWTGTWRLNVEKSTYSDAPPKSGTSRLTRTADGGMRMIQDQITAEDTAVHAEFSGAFDGRAYAVDGLAGVTYALTRVDDHTYVLVAKRNGVTTSITVTVVSADRNTRISTTAIPNAQGRAVANIAVYDRVLTPRD